LQKSLQKSLHNFYNNHQAIYNKGLYPYYGTNR